MNNANKIDYENIFNVDPNCKHNDVIICIDPSGSTKNGFGTTGLAVACVNNKCRILYVDSIPLLVDYTPLDLVSTLIGIIDVWNKKNLEVVIENYISYGQNIGVESETKYIVDSIKWYCTSKQIKVSTPLATLHNARFSDQILKKYKVNLSKYNSHEKDAIRMVLYTYMFVIGRKEK